MAFNIKARVSCGFANVRGAEGLKNYVIEQLQNYKRKDIKYEIQHSRRST